VLSQNFLLHGRPVLLVVVVVVVVAVVGRETQQERGR